MCEFDHVFDPLSRENPFHFRAFPIPAGVDIALHCNVRTGVSQQLAERLYVASGLQTSCGKSVAQSVRIYCRHTGTVQIAAQAFAVAARFYRLVGIAGQEPFLRCVTVVKPVQNLQNSFRNRDLSYGAVRFGCLDGKLLSAHLLYRCA